MERSTVSLMSDITGWLFVRVREGMRRLDVGVNLRGRIVPVASCTCQDVRQPACSSALRSRPAASARPARVSAPPFHLGLLGYVLEGCRLHFVAVPG